MEKLTFGDFKFELNSLGKVELLFLNQHFNVVSPQEPTTGFVYFNNLNFNRMQELFNNITFLIDPKAPQVFSLHYVDMAGNYVATKSKSYEFKPIRIESFVEQKLQILEYTVIGFELLEAPKPSLLARELSSLINHKDSSSMEVDSYRRLFLIISIIALLVISGLIIFSVVSLY